MVHHAGLLHLRRESLVMLLLLLMWSKGQHVMLLLVLLVLLVLLKVLLLGVLLLGVLLLRMLVMLLLLRRVLAGNGEHWPVVKVVELKFGRLCEPAGAVQLLDATAQVDQAAGAGRDLEGVGGVDGKGAGAGVVHEPELVENVGAVGPLEAEAASGEGLNRGVVGARGLGRGAKVLDVRFDNLQGGASECDRVATTKVSVKKEEKKGCVVCGRGSKRTE